MFLAILLKIQRSIYRLKCGIRITFLILTRRTIQNDPKFICFSHLRCATKSIGKILETISDLKNLNCFWGYRPISEKSLRDLLSKYHIIFFHEIMPGEFPNKFNGINFRGFHITRDPRNILVSQYFSYRYTHEVNWKIQNEIMPTRNYLCAHSKEEGLLFLMKQSKHFLQTMGAFDQWKYTDNRLLEIRFEDYVRDPKRYWKNILSFIDITFDEKKLDKILQCYSFQNLKRMSWKTNGITHYRSAQPDDYVQHFSPRVKSLFKQLYGELLIKLGYEKNKDW